jgi:hypothetical protein
MLDLLRLFRVVNEMIFVVIGALLLWVAFAGRFLFDPPQPSWLILAGVVIVWGIYTWRRARRIAPPRTRLAMKIGGGSVALVGLIMASLAWAPLAWAAALLGTAGGIFVVRGLVTAVILALPS